MADFLQLSVHSEKNTNMYYRTIFARRDWNIAVVIYVSKLVLSNIYWAGETT
jgi:hypothetical protein